MTKTTDITSKFEAINEKLGKADEQRQHEIKEYADAVTKANKDLEKANKAFNTAEKALNFEDMDQAQTDKENAQKRIRLYQKKVDELEKKGVVSYKDYQENLQEIKGLLDNVVFHDRERLTEIKREIEAMKDKQTKLISQGNELIIKSYAKSLEKGQVIIGGAYNHTYSSPLLYTLNIIDNTLDAMK